MLKILLSILTAATLTACAIPKPGAFYHNISAAGAKPGAILKRSPFPSPADATATRIIYASIGVNGHVVPVSGVIYIPTAPAPAGGRDIIAWAHPTTGIVAGCAPSLGNDTFGGRDLAGTIPGLHRFLEAGDIVTATDYLGLGVAGVHPYLIGPAEADDLIDSVRAARALPGANASRNYGVWGHSQGAQAALFVGQTAQSYAPGLHLVGVAAAAPPTDLGPELTAPFTSNTGRLLSAYVYATWSKLYHVPITTIVKPTSLPGLQRSVKKCINSIGQYLVASRTSGALKGFIARDPMHTPPWPALFHQNSPGYAKSQAPLLITQGTSDTTVYPRFTDAFDRRACNLGDVIDYVKLKGVGHIFAGYRSAKIVAGWFAARFADAPPLSNCRK